MRFTVRAAVLTAVVIAVASLRSADADDASTQPTTGPTAVAWADAAKHVGETVTVSGPVISTHKSANGKTVSLNIGKDYPAADRFTVYLTTDKADKADDTYKGKTVTVTGKIELYGKQKVAEIKAAEKDITVEK